MKSKKKKNEQVEGVFYSIRKLSMGASQLVEITIIDGEATIDVIHRDIPSIVAGKLLLSIQNQNYVGDNDTD